MAERNEYKRVGEMLDSVFVTFRAKGLKVKQPGLMRLVVSLISCMMLLTSGMSYTAFASFDPGRETDNDPPSIEISREMVFRRPGGLTVTCPDGTVNDVVRRCESPLNTGCPPNKVVIFTQTGECVVVGVPVTCPDGTLAPNEADCNIPPISTTTPLQPLPTQQKQLQNTS